MPPARGDHDARRRDVSEAVWRVLVARGFGGLTLRAVAAEMGASTGLLTHYFPSKRALLRSALDVLAQRSDERPRRTAPAEGLPATGRAARHPAADRGERRRQPDLGRLLGRRPRGPRTRRRAQRALPAVAREAGRACRRRAGARRAAWPTARRTNWARRRCRSHSGWSSRRSSHRTSSRRNAKWPSWTGGCWGGAGRARAVRGPVRGDEAGPAEGQARAEPPPPPPLRPPQG